LYFVGDFVGGEEVEEAILTPLSYVGNFVGKKEEEKEEKEKAL
jgi:hypothetical protein